MNRLAKGRRIELLAKKWYEARGWTVYKPPWNRWGEKDIFGWGDLLCVKMENTPKMVQVRVRSEASHIERDGKGAAARYLAESGFRSTLLLYAGKREQTNRVPEWEEREWSLIHREWATYTPPMPLSSPRSARPSSPASPSKASPASSATRSR